MEQERKRRWYDEDPVLSKAFKIIETSDDQLQIQIALNLIKIIIEHNMSDDSSVAKEAGNSRWYDIEDTLRTAMQLLRSCSNEMQGKIAQDIGSIVASALNEIYDDNQEQSDSE
jgi:hypothetical protein